MGSASNSNDMNFFKGSCVFWLLMVGRKSDARKLLDAGPFDNLEQFWDAVCEGQAGTVRPRGINPSTDEGFRVMTVDDLLAHSQFCEILAADEAPPASALDKLPEPRAFAKLGVTFPWGSVAQFLDMSSMVPAMLAHERVGRADDALECTAIILEGDRAEGGGGTSRMRSFAHACRGRVLASQGKTEAAEAAFEASVSLANAGKMPFLAALALRDLCKLVLDGVGRGEEGRQRLVGVVEKLSCSVEDLNAIAFP
jgi:hypothetical protein